MSAPAPDPKPGTPEELKMHIFSTYWNLRYGMAIVAFALPLLVIIVAKLFGGVEWQQSISDYYWAPRKPNVRPPSRDVFVGGLFALAIAFYLYKGFFWKENWALNAAALLALGVALFPMAEVDSPASKLFTWDWFVGTLSLHGTCAVLMFVFLVYVVFARSEDTLKILEEIDPPKAKKYRVKYRSIAAIMAVSPLVAYFVNAFRGGNNLVFIIEALGIWAFAAYWWFKSREMKYTSVTAKALRGELRLDPTTGALHQVPAARAAAAEPAAAREAISGF